MPHPINAKMARAAEGEDKRQNTFRQGQPLGTAAEVELLEAAELTEPFGE